MLFQNNSFYQIMLHKLTSSEEDYTMESEFVEYKRIDLSFFVDYTGI
jgi:hypothetical protein